MIGWMATDFFAQSPVLAFPLLALGIFFSLFILVNVVLVVRGRGYYADVAQLPLEDDKAVDHE